MIFFEFYELHVIKVVDVVNKLWSGEGRRNTENEVMREHGVRSEGDRRS